jgi:Lon protease-like protein
MWGLLPPYVRKHVLSTPLHKAVTLTYHTGAINCRDDEVIMQLKGRQRFHILSLQRRNGVLFARVQLLHDVEPAVGPDIIRTYHCNYHSIVNPFPRWVYEAGCARMLCKQIISVLELRRLIARGSAGLFKQLKVEAEVSPQSFSYTLAASLPLSVQDRLSLLDSPDVSSRLRQVNKPDHFNDKTDRLLLTRFYSQRNIISM